jgi:hypothetical protein
MANNKNQKGYWLDDPFLSYIKGHTRYEETSHDGMQFTVELRGLQALFPYTRDPSDHFVITHLGSRISRILNEHFITRQRSYERIYGNMFDITGFFGSILEQTAIYGDNYYAIRWTVPENTTDLILVDDFTYLHASTMHVKRSLGRRIRGYKQRYSRLAFLNHSYDRERKVRSFDFAPDEILHIKYPFGKIQPTKQSMGLLKKSQAYWKFTLDYTRSGGSVVGMGVNAERARYKKYAAEQRAFQFTRAIICKNFHQFESIRELPRTDYYDAYILCRYMRDKVQARQFLVDQFNEQVLVPLARRNNIKKPPVLELVNLTTEAEVDDLMSAVEKNLIDHNEFIELFNTFQ